MPTDAHWNPLLSVFPPSTLKVMIAFFVAVSKVLKGDWLEIGVYVFHKHSVCIDNVKFRFCRVFETSLGCGGDVVERNGKFCCTKCAGCRGYTRERDLVDKHLRKMLFVFACPCCDTYDYRPHYITQHMRSCGAMAAEAQALFRASDGLTLFPIPTDMPSWHKPEVSGQSGRRSRKHRPAARHPGLAERHELGALAPVGLHAEQHQPLLEQHHHRAWLEQDLTKNLMLLMATPEPPCTSRVFATLPEEGRPPNHDLSLYSGIGSPLDPLALESASATSFSEHLLLDLDTSGFFPDEEQLHSTLDLSPLSAMSVDSFPFDGPFSPTLSAV